MCSIQFHAIDVDANIGTFQNSDKNKYFRKENNFCV